MRARERAPSAQQFDPPGFQLVDAADDADLLVVDAAFKIGAVRL